MIHISNKTYEVFVDHKNGWRPEAFRERYSEVLDRYDYIVGDWGYNQLRLRGFFKDNHPKATKDTVISTIQDYLNEYCNFGCAYFILEKTATREIPPSEEGSDEVGAEEDFEPVQGAGALPNPAAPAVQERKEQAPMRHNPHVHASRAESKQEQGRPAPSGGGRNQGRGQQESTGKQGGSQQGSHKANGPSPFRGKDGKPGSSNRNQHSLNAQGSPRSDRNDRPDRSDRQERNEQGGRSQGASNHNQVQGSKPHRNHGHSQKPKPESSRV